MKASRTWLSVVVGCVAAAAAVRGTQGRAGRRSSDAEAEARFQVDVERWEHGLAPRHLSAERMREYFANE